MDTHRCHACQAEKPASGQRRMIPRGWKRHAGQLHCDDCFSRRYVLRAIYLFVAEPLDATWQEVDAACREQFAVVTRLKNWMQNQLYASDPARHRQGEKMPPMPRINIYPKDGDDSEFDLIRPSTRAALANSVQGVYRQSRYAAVWTCSESLRSYKYPQPLPVSAQDWKSTVGDGGQAIVNVPIGRRRFQLRLSAGQGRAKRALRDFREIVSGAALGTELTIERRKCPGSHRHSTPQRQAGQRASTRLAVKIVGYFPRRELAHQREGTLFVRTDSDSLLVALDAKNKRLWIEHADHLRRWVVRHRRQLQRWSDDTKAEQRPVPSFAAKRRDTCDRYRRRLDSAVHELSAHVVGLARRRRFAAVQYDDSTKTFVEKFPWEQLRRLIAQKCEREGIGFIHARRRSDGFRRLVARNQRKGRSVKMLCLARHLQAQRERGPQRLPRGNARGTRNKRRGYPHLRGRPRSTL